MALRDALAETGGVWFGWSGALGARRQAAPARVREDGIAFVTTDLTQEDFDGYYAGYANSVLWPLFHERLHAMEYRDEYLTAYLSVNAYYGALAARELVPGDRVWVHDYQLIPLGAELRRHGHRGPLGFFLHIPFPPYDVFRALPDRHWLLEAFLAYDLVGFQTPLDTRHFAFTLGNELGAEVDLEAGVARHGDRTVRFGTFPIGIDPDGTAAEAHGNRETPLGRRLTRTLRDRKLVIGADRLDYTKGLVERFQAYERFLELNGDEVDDELIYVQITAPSRQDVREYQEISQQLEAESGRINGRHARIHWTPLRLIERNVPRPVLLGYFSLAHVGLVTPLRDGMNLVAKEFLAAQTEDDPGVLVLSSLAGAAEELGEPAVLVNPYNPDEVAEGLLRALRMPLPERRRRWEQAMGTLRANTADAWRRRFLDALGAAAAGAPP